VEVLEQPHTDNISFYLKSKVPHLAERNKALCLKYNCLVEGHSVDCWSEHYNMLYMILLSA
jgi:hypothetical protein